jgi:hypothetical protein
MIGHGLFARRIVGQRDRWQIQLPSYEADERLQVHARQQNDLGQRHSRVSQQSELHRES